MDQITLRIPEDTLRDIDDYTDEHDTTRSEYIRDVLETHRDIDDVRMGYLRDMAELQREYEDRIDELEDEVEWLKGRVQAKENEFETLVAQREENTELKEYVSEQQRRQELGWVRSKWNDLTGWE